jgi:hypothetical protein
MGLSGYVVWGWYWTKKMKKQMYRTCNVDESISVLLLFLLTHYVPLASKQAAVIAVLSWKVTENGGDEYAKE